MKVNVSLYVRFTEDFLEKKISPKCFKYAYMRVFLAEENEWPELEFAILNTLFLDVEEFCADPELIGEHDIDEKELRKRCRVALEKLKQL